MSYEIYKQILSKEDYFKTWKNQKDLENINEEIQQSIYDKHVIKSLVMQRDKFVCQNVGCESDLNLSLHHIKAQRNNGKDSERNCVILCRKCHKAFEERRDTFTLANFECLPSHIRGHTFRKHKSEKINWKKIRTDMKALRKQLKYKYGDKLTYITWEQIILLMRVLEQTYEGYDD